MAVERDTRGLQLREMQRLNFYPASPLPSISWQLQRSMKGLAGQSQRDLQLYARTEKAFALSERGDVEKMSLAAVAAVARYSDQSHLGREVKRVTGFSPRQFDERLQNDEAFWMYRLLRGYLHDGEFNTRK